MKSLRRPWGMGTFSSITGLLFVVFSFTLNSCAGGGGGSNLIPSAPGPGEGPPPSGGSPTEEIIGDGSSSSGEPVGSGSVGGVVGNLVAIGEGCTTAYWIDKDCDGRVFGGKVQKSETFFPHPIPPNLEPDADDNDPTVHSTQTVINKYGSLSDMDSIKAYLDALGYNHYIGDIYFVAPNGGAGQKNNPNKPYSYGWVDAINTSTVQPGDVIMYRGGKYNTELGTQGAGSPLQGTAAKPILMIAYPGEEPIFTDTSGTLSIAKNTRYVTIHGLVFDGKFGEGTTPNDYARQLVTINLGPMNNITFNYNQFRRSNKWGIFASTAINGSGTATNRDYLVFNNNVIHAIAAEHCFYHNDSDSNPSFDTDIGWDINGNILYNCERHAIHWRGGEDIKIRNNIAHSTNYFGLEIKSGWRYIDIRRNFFFNCGKGPLMVWDEPDTQNGSGSHDITIAENTFLTKSGSNGIGELNTSSFSAITFHHAILQSGKPKYSFDNIKIVNNYLYSPFDAPIKFLWGDPNVNDLQDAVIQDNVIWNQLGGSNAKMLTVCNHNGNGTPTNGPYNSRYYPSCYDYSFTAMENNPNWPGIQDNIAVAPGAQIITNMNNINTTNFTPWLYDPTPLATSPGIDAADPLNSTPLDLRRNIIINLPDIGAIEEIPSSP